MSRQRIGIHIIRVGQRMVRRRLKNIDRGFCYAIPIHSKVERRACQTAQRLAERSSTKYVLAQGDHESGKARTAA
jgi:hypothetical protein